jgi:hypothetical protein
MSVLTDLAISYETLPGEPSFFNFFEDSPASSHFRDYSVPVIANTVQKTDHITQKPLTPQHSQTQKQTPVHIAPQKLDADFTSRPIARPIARTATAHRTAAVSRPVSTQPEHRGLFNEFERAALLSHMQTRTTAY